LSSNTSKKETSTKKLFIISPIGEPKSDVRIYFDKARRHIIDPIAAKKGYVTSRADNISRPGRITKQIIERLREDDLVVADLTQRNPNVFYELAVRHAVGKPVILMTEIGEQIPFDVAAQRVIFYDLDPDNIEEAKNELEKQISEVESAKFIVDSPIEVPISLEHKKKSGNGEQQEIIAILRNQSEQLRRLEENQRVRQEPISIDSQRLKVYPTQATLRSVDMVYFSIKSIYKRAGYKVTSADWFQARSKAEKWSVTNSYHKFDSASSSLKTKPEILIIGNGAVGMMKITEELRKFIEEKGIQCLDFNTAQACNEFNKFKDSGEKIAVALHLTC